MKKRRFFLFSDEYSKSITIGMLLLLIFSSAMIVSANMGPVKGEYAIAEVAKTLFKQLVIVGIGFIGYSFCINFDFFKFNTKVLDKVAIFIVVFLVGTRILTPQSIGGAYAWYNLGFFTLQASEVAKVFDIIFIAKMLSIRYQDDMSAEIRFKHVAAYVFVYFLIIVGWEKDLGSAVILLGMAYFMLLVPSQRGYVKFQKLMTILMLIGIVAILFVLSPGVIHWLDSLNSSNYQIQRFVVAANPFEKRFDSGYHLVMSLVSFATGGIFGLGYGRSTHKYMNFPNPDSDFILPVIVEELGIIGFIFIIALYIAILFPMIHYAFKRESDDRARIVLVGVSMYFILHFILNVGGVSGLIPLTGVPILLVSYGGTQTLTSMCAIAIAQREIARIKGKANL